MASKPNKLNSDAPTPRNAPTPRKLIALLTNDEWRALRVSAAEADTTIQGYVTGVVLRELQRNGKVARR